MARNPQLRQRDRDGRGAALVEFAIVVPLFLLLVMGIIDFASAYNDYNSLRSGAAESARQAAVGNVDYSGCSGTSTQKLVCMTKARSDLDATRMRVKIDVNTAYQVGDSVKVCTMYDLESITGMFDVILGNKALKAESEMRLESLNADAITDYSDTALTGQNWNFC